MAADPDKAALALHRFGFGPRAGSIAAIAADPQGALAAELDRPHAGQIADPELLSSAAAYRAVFEFNAARASQAKLARRGAQTGEPDMKPVTATTEKPASDERRPVPLPQRNFLAEAKARIAAARDADIGGRFVFIPRAHEPGTERVLGKDYPDTGVAQGRAVLADLARHPATATHIATKLAIHFISDDPPPALIDRLARRFRDTDGDLKEVAKALIAAPEAWEPQQTKLKRPGEWLVAALRATGQAGDIRRVVGAQALLGEPLWRPPAPKGFPDDNAAWLDGVAERLEIANAFAQTLSGLDPAAVAETALGPLASVETNQAIARAESRPQALTLALMAPEFLRR